jgi:hypothetical protein
MVPSLMLFEPASKIFGLVGSSVTVASACANLRFETSTSGPIGVSTFGACEQAAGTSATMSSAGAPARRISGQSRP